MRRLARYPQLGALVVCAGLLSLAFASPLATALRRESLGRLVADYSNDGWTLPLLRSSAFALVTTFICIPAAFVLALVARDCTRSLHGFLSVLMAPMMIGGVSLAFCVKIAVLRSDFAVGLIAQRAFLPTWGLLFLSEAWQLLTLATYLFWFRLQLVPARILRFAQASRLTTLECVRDVYWPHTRNLAGVLSLFAATACFYDFVKPYLILRASPGGNTELASHWLLRFYKFYSSVDPAAASRMTLAMAAAGIAPAMAVAGAAMVAAVGGMDLCTRYLGRIGASPHRPRAVQANVVAVSLVVTTIAPLAYLLPYLQWGVFVPIGDFVRSVGLAMSGAVVALGVSVLLGIAGRVLLKKTMERFGGRSALVFAALYLLQAIPGIAVALCGYYWLGALSSRDTMATWVPVLWLACQVVIVLPVTTGFVQVSHFRVRTDELEFQESSRAGVVDLVRTSFLRRFQVDYLLVAIFGFSLVWTESTVNATLSNLSRTIPSIAVELSQRVDGRGASYSEAASLIMATLVPVGLGLALWVFDVKRRGLLQPVIDGSEASARAGGL